MPNMISRRVFAQQAALLLAGAHPAFAQATETENRSVFASFGNKIASFFVCGRLTLVFGICSSAPVAVTLVWTSK